jgi:hypothetical protein
MEQNAQTGDTVPSALRLRSGGVEAAGQALGLRPGDMLETINGRPFRGDEAALRACFAERGGRPLALGFRRGTETFLVLGATARLGRWETVPCPLPDAAEGRRIDPEGLENYQVMRSELGVYDLYPTRPSVLAMIAPPLWLMQMRLWAQGATVVAALTAAAVVTPVLAAVVWIAAGLWVRRTAVAFLRADRRGRGLRFDGVIAARSEAEAHATYLARHAGDRYLFAPAMPATEQAA